MHLSRLDNEVIFKKAFTDKLVFTQFVKDVIGIDIKVGKIETEKRFKPKIAYIDFAYDIFAESTDERVRNVFCGPPTRKFKVCGFV
ncbi:hypothetical protein THIOM_003075, partial [Candidatus Thiomargarita nelsonii]